MDNNYQNRQVHHHARHRRSGGSFLGTLLIILGLIFILKEIGWHIGLPAWDAMRHSFGNFLNVFHLQAWNITWPVILLVVGILVVAGRRVIGTLLIVLALIFVLPHIVIPGLVALLFFPVLLVILGVILISKIL